MLKYSIDAEGVLKNLEAMQKQCPKEILGAVQEALEAGVSSAKYLVPKDTLKLMQSIEIDEKPRESSGTITGSYSAIALNSNGKNYGFYQEVGFVDKKGTFHEGRFYMLGSKIKAEKVFIKRSNAILGRYSR